MGGGGGPGMNQQGNPRNFAAPVDREYLEGIGPGMMNCILTYSTSACPSRFNHLFHSIQVWHHKKGQWQIDLEGPINPLHSARQTRGGGGGGPGMNQQRNPRNFAAPVDREYFGDHYSHTIFIFTKFQGKDFFPKEFCCPCWQAIFWRPLQPHKIFFQQVSGLGVFF